MDGVMQLEFPVGQTGECRYSVAGLDIRATRPDLPCNRDAKPVTRRAGLAPKPRRFNAAEPAVRGDRRSARDFRITDNPRQQQGPNGTHEELNASIC